MSEPHSILEVVVLLPLDHYPQQLANVTQVLPELPIRTDRVLALFTGRLTSKVFPVDFKKLESA